MAGALHICGDVYRAYIDPFGWLPPPDYSAGWFGPWGAHDTAHYFPDGSAHSACWRWERPETWPPVEQGAPPERACARCLARWQRDQRRQQRKVWA